MSWQTTDAPELVELVRRQQAESDQDGIEGGRVVPLRRKEDVTCVGALVEIAQLVEEQPAHDLERAEAGADVSRPRAGNHVQRVDTRQRCKRSGRRHRIGIRAHDSRELRRRYETKL